MATPNTLRAAALWLGGALLASAPAYAGPAVEAGGGASSAPATLAFIPPESALVIHADITSLAGEPKVLAARERIPLFPRVWRRLDWFVSQAGLELSRDLENVSFGGRPEGGEGRGLVLIARGRIVSARAAEALRARGWSRLESGGTPLLIAPPGSEPVPAASTGGRRRAPVGPPEPIVASFPRPGWALAGEKSWVLSALKAGQGGAECGVRARPEPLGGLIASALAGRGQAWLILATPDLTRHTVRRLFPADTVGAVESLISLDSLTVTLRSGSETSVRGEAIGAGAQEAGLFADAVRAAVALSKIQAGQGDPASLDALRSIRVDQDGPRVTVSALLPDSLLVPPDKPKPR